MYRQWCIAQKRVNRLKSRLARRYPGKYILVCVHTGRYGIGNPSVDGQGGHTDASDNFDLKYGYMKDCAEKWRDFLGVSLHS